LALPLFALTLFVSAFLLFLVQPMVGKMILPRLGGTPQVWNTCMVFFQSVLLAGYAYTHTVSTRLTVRRQLLIHSILLLVPFLVLFPAPFDIAESFTPPAGANPLPYTLVYLTLIVGLPFFVVSTSAPLLQKWFATTGHPAAKDPYFLYGASNLGSLLALLLYPVAVEPTLLLREQAWTWAIGYILLGAFVAACAFLVWRTAPDVELGMAGETLPLETPVPPMEDVKSAVQAAPPPVVPKGGVARKKGKGGGFKPAEVPLAPEPEKPRPEVVTFWRRLRWVLLAAVPSSLMLGVTSYICTDISPIPLLWIVPLSLYLVSFILVFSKWPVVWTGTPHRVMLFTQPLFLLGLCAYLARGGFTPSVSITISLLAFFLTAMVCHGELARDRPTTRHLTEFYLCLSLGGMLGGFFNGLLAPLLFVGVVEFPLALILACFLRPTDPKEGLTDQKIQSWLPDLQKWSWEKGKDLARAFNISPQGNFLLYTVIDVFWAIVVLVLCFFLTGNSPSWGWLSGTGENPLSRFLKVMGLPVGWTHSFYVLLVFGVPLFICFLFSHRAARLGLAVAAFLLVNLGIYERGFRREPPVYATRSYFGVLRVNEGGSNPEALHKILQLAEKAREKGDPEERKKIEGELAELEKKGHSLYTNLSHGTTLHGRNYQFPEKLSRLASTYYHQMGPVGRVMDKFNWFKDGEVPELVGDKKGSPIHSYHSDARMPACLVGLATAGLGMTNLPVGQLVGAWSEPPCATIGLGTGTMASYGRPLQHVHFYEIDNLVRKMSLPLDDPRPYYLGGHLYFNYLMHAKQRGSEVQVRMGDARLRMKEPYQVYDEEKEKVGLGVGGGPESFYHMMVVDAFSSDAIPVHLITTQAIEMYFDKLVPEGILCVHISNRHLLLAPVVVDAASQIEMVDPRTGKKGPLVCLRGHDHSDWWQLGHSTSEWVMVSRSKAVLEDLRKRVPPAYKETLLAQYKNATESQLESYDYLPYWRFLTPTGARPWTDDFSNIWSVFRW